MHLKQIPTSTYGTAEIMLEWENLTYGVVVCPGLEASTFGDLLIKQLIVVGSSTSNTLSLVWWAPGGTCGALCFCV